MDRRTFLLSGGVGCGALLLRVAVAGATACTPTVPNPEGPFYLPDAPFAHDLSHPEEQGRPLSVQGRVLGMTANGCASLPDAVVDVWHASDRGIYYGLEQGGAPDPLALRGRVRTDSLGRYAFRTILPGHYPLSPSRFRPRHIHYRVSAPSHRTLITQLYFGDDPHLPGDPLAHPSLVADLTESGGVLRCAFDVTLEPRA